jgi:hypothetical protein
MADDWEQEDWEKEDFTPVLPGAAAAVQAGAEQKAAEPTFEDEDTEPQPEKEHTIKPQVRGLHLDLDVLAFTDAADLTKFGRKVEPAAELLDCSRALLRAPCAAR